MSYLLAVDVTSNEASMDGFINDIIPITVDDKHWIDCTKIVALLVIHTLFRSLKPSELLERCDPLSVRKLVGKGQLAEQHTCQGGEINTHSLRVFLPKDK